MFLSHTIETAVHTTDGRQAGARLAPRLTDSFVCASSRLLPTTDLYC